MYRDHTRTIKIGDRVIGGGNPVLIQSMTNTNGRCGTDRKADFGAGAGGL